MSSEEENSDHLSGEEDEEEENKNNLSGEDEEDEDDDEQVGGDDDEEEEDEEEEEEEDNDDDEDVEEDEEKGPSGNRKRKRPKDIGSKAKKKKTMVSQFIEEEADVNEDDDEEEEDYEHYYGDEKVEAEHEAEIIEQRHRFHNERMNIEKETAEEIVDRIKRRHQKSKKRFNDEDEGLDEVQSDVAQQSLLPSVADTKLWVFKCTPGREQHLVLALMNKFIDFADKDTPLGIKSVIASSTKGFIYVEADREPHAKEAVTGLREISHWTMRLVPIHEMTSVLNIQTRRKPIVAGSWARVKRVGLYKGDLCKVLEVLDSGTRAFVKLIPRLDPAELSGQMPQKYAKGQRPAQRLFNANSVGSGGELSRRRHPLTGDMFDLYDNEWYKDGFLHKEFNIKTMLVTEEVEPTLDEVQKFSQTQEQKDENNETVAIDVGDGPAAWNKKVELAKGDTVRVVSGDFTGLIGVIVEVSSAANSAKISPLHEEIKDTILELQIQDLMKFVKVGSHVKVVSGRYSGETGTVVSVDENGGTPVAIVLADSMAKEIQVRVRDVQESSEICTGLDSLKGKELYDLVSIAHGEVGVITHVGRDSFKIVTQNGQSRSVSDEEIQRKIQSSRAVALDKSKNHISPGDMVTVVDSKYSGQNGTIKHLHRAFVFLHNNGISKDAGIFVVKTKNVVLAGSRRRGGEENPMAAKGPYIPPPNRNQGNNRGSEMMGKTVKIKKGRWKGYLGMVIEETEMQVKIEIHSKNASVSVDKQFIVVIGNRLGLMTDNPRTSATPMIGSATPMPSQTPLHSGSMTPMHTPLHIGSTTPSAPRTPGEAWNPALNSSGEGHDQDMSYAARYGTPLDPVTPMQEAATPAGLAYSPAPELAATPGIGFNPTTPGIHYGTPSVVTPGVFPPQTPNTPGGIGGMTPAPMTPALDMATDMGSYAAEESSAVASWVSVGIEVSLISKGDYEGTIGTITGVQGGVCTVESNGKVLRIGTDSLRPVPPEKHNRVKFISGDCAGRTGSLIGTDLNDCIVKMDGTAEIMISNQSDLAKLSF